ncbi:hypothetical protein XNC1_3008 [Xenorhabdus nematophila ATCC 19061]|uniref:Uncharacterized protein n=2 Tax=Xenorhabdus nematophila TaxID=628 RepID=D3VK03_XENNA|nr:hypothetical protein XNC1_3008 [Xenorhabdus nematophila ATCC 19061]CEK23884.1 hypothetical protein XNC2_2890 [Xenorhabdus nematophila AN6/1]
MHQFEGCFLVICQINFHGRNHDLIRMKNQAPSITIGIEGDFAINEKKPACRKGDFVLDWVSHVLSSFSKFMIVAK